jgi:hypothetical protein
MGTDLPYVDTHRVRITVARDRVWTAVRESADSIGIGPRNPLALVLGTEPRSGFEIAHEVPPRQLGLAGRHRFARYLLVFDLAEAGDGETLLSAHTYSDFRGPHGQVYRALVIGTRLHVVATRSILRSIRHRSSTTRPV